MNLYNPEFAVERYEKRFLISKEMAQSISNYAEFFCHLNPEVKVRDGIDHSEDYYYVINNLYLDSEKMFGNLTADKKKLENGLGDAFKFYMRVRSYGCEIKKPYFFELKYQIRDFIKKKRCQVNTESWAHIIQCKSGLQNISSDLISGPYLEDFIFMVMTYKVKPVLQTQFKRKSYLSKENIHTKINFDVNYVWKENEDWLFDPDIQKNGKARFGKDEVILELKWKDKMPDWMNAMIQEFSLNSKHFSKYNYPKDMLIQ